MTRRCIVYKNNFSEEIEFEGEFHQFSIESDDGEHHPVAIVELDDGSIKNIYSESIRFIDK